MSLLLSRRGNFSQVARPLAPGDSTTDNFDSNSLGSFTAIKGSIANWSIAGGLLSNGAADQAIYDTRVVSDASGNLRHRLELNGLSDDVGVMLYMPSIGKGLMFRNPVIGAQQFWSYDLATTTFTAMQSMGFSTSAGPKFLEIEKLRNSVICRTLDSSGNVIDQHSFALTVASGNAATYGSGVISYGGLRAFTAVSMASRTLALPLTISTNLPVTTGLRAHFAADDVLTRTPYMVSGNPVPTWLDLSGNGSAAEDPNPGSTDRRPTLITNVLNGLPGLLFNGSKYLEAALVTLTQPDTILMVMKLVAAAGANENVFDGMSGRQAIIITTAPALAMYAGSVQTDGAIDTSAHLVTFLANGASSNLRKDRVSVLSASPGANSITAGWRIGSNSSAGGFYNGYIMELAGYNSMSTTDRDTVETYLRTKWATP
jgi:hypothetical protein